MLSGVPLIAGVFLGYALRSYVSMARRQRRHFR
jgi:hypothetical protein